MLYEVAIVEEPTNKSKDSGQIEKLLLPPTPIIAKNEQAAKLAAIKKIKLADTDTERLAVLIRPFSFDESEL